MVLTQGGRSDELTALADSFELPAGGDAVLVANGATGTVAPPPGWRSVATSENLGVPGGRNFGAAQTAGDFVIFLDDDARALRADLVAAVEHRFRTETDLGAIGFRIVKPGSLESQQRWSPHIGMGDTDRTADVTTFVGGGHAVRRAAFDEVGGYFAPLFYGLEETDLAWRLIDAGWRVSFDAELILEHPDIDQSRHPNVVRRTARNRVWLARRRLPAVLVVVYLGVWMVIQLARSRTWGQLREVCGGSVEGMRTCAGARNPMRWSTVLHMARLRRPPII